MKFILLFLCLVVITTPAFGHYQKTRQVQPYSRDNLNLQVQPDTKGNSILRGIQSYSPSWLTRWLPNLNQLLFSALNTLEGIPAGLVSSTINKICSTAIRTGILKPSYSIPEEQVSLELYTDNDVVSFPMRDVKNLLNHNGFDSNKNVTIFVNSWGANKNAENKDNDVYALAQAYKQRGTDNFILFDVSEFVGNIYRWFTLDTKSIGQVLGDAIVSLSKDVPLANIHVIGHDLGANIAGNAGRRVQKVKDQQIARITALDPPMICYDESHGFYGIQPGDAAFVDVIHTNNGVLGKRNPVGDADFYPNGPIYLQPGCFNVVCAHKRALLYYIESVFRRAEGNFLAQHCSSFTNMKNKKCHDSKVPMGIATPPSARGYYYLETNGQSPYGKDASSDYSSNELATVEDLEPNRDTPANEQIDTLPINEDVLSISNANESPKAQDANVFPNELDMVSEDNTDMLPNEQDLDQLQNGGDDLSGPNVSDALSGSDVEQV